MNIDLVIANINLDQERKNVDREHRIELLARKLTYSYEEAKKYDKNNYIGKHESYTDFCRDVVEATEEYLTLPNFIRIDWEMTERELSHDYITIDVHDGVHMYHYKDKISD